MIALVVLAYNVRKPTTTPKEARLENFVVSISERKKVLILDSVMAKGHSLGIYARDNTFRVKEIDRSYRIKPSSHFSVSHIIMD